VAAGYGFGFDNCPVGTGTQKGVMRAAAGALASTLQTQVDAQVGDASAVTGGLNERDLVTVMVGILDVKALLAQGGDEGTRLAEARARGVAIGRAVNGIVARGARVIVATVPEMGYSPFGRAAGGDLLTRLSRELNAGIRTSITADGRKWAVVLTDDLVKAAVNTPSSFSLTDVSTPACDATKAPLVQDCTTDTLVPGATASGWLWADDTWFAPGGHRELGARARSQARDNPF
jgi:outer membrane lipase/esterase